MTKSIPFSTLQVCSVFYLAANTNGTLRGLFYHILSVIYPSIFFYVCFVEISERLAKTFQFLKIFTAAIQDHLDINIRHKQLVNPSQRNSLYCAVHLANLEDILGLSVLSIILVKAGLMKCAHPVRLRMTLAAQDSEGKCDGEWIFCQRKETDIALFLQVTRMRKTIKICEANLKAILLSQNVVNGT